MIKVMSREGAAKARAPRAWKGRLYPPPRPLEMEAGKQEKREEKQVRSEKSPPRKKPFLSFSPPACTVPAARFPGSCHHQPRGCVATCHSELGEAGG